MEYRPLGRPGLEVSVMSVGAAAMGGEFGDRREAESIETVHRAIDMGVDAITTDFPGRLRARLSARAEKRPSATKGAGL